MDWNFIQDLYILCCYIYIFVVTCFIIKETIILTHTFIYL